MRKNDRKPIHLVNGLGADRTIFVSKKNWIKHKIEYGEITKSPENRKTSRRKYKKSMKPDIPRTTISGRPPQRGVKNWRERQKRFANRKRGLGHHVKKTKDTDTR